MKIYNEVIIDMNTGETIYEDSFDYEGDIASCCDPNAPGATTYNLTTAEGKQGAAEVYGFESWDAMQESKADEAKELDDKKRGWGLEALSMDQFYDTDEAGNKVPKTEDQILSLILQHKPYNKDVHKGMDEGQYKQSVMNQIRDIMPKLTSPDVKKQAFVTEQYGKYDPDTGKAGIAMTEAGLTKTKAEDMYGLEGRATSAAQREKAGLEEAYDLGIGAAGRMKGAAEDVYGAAEEAYELGERKSQRGLQAGLGQLQGSAAQAGAQARGAYGGMGGGARGAIGAQATMAKGLGQTYGAYTDTQTALTGAKKRAESAYGRAEGTYADEMTRLRGSKERGLGAVSDEMLRIEQERGYSGDEYSLAERKASLAEEKGLYGIEGEAEAEWEGQMGQFLGGLTGFKKGGRVPSKETFLQALTKLPDAGGS